MRSLSAPALEAMLSEHTGEVVLTLIRIFPPGETSPGNALRFVDDESDVAITSGGLEYTPLGFRLALPEDEGERLPTVSIAIDNVGQDVSEAVLTYVGSVNIEVEFVLASSPDTVEAGPWRFVVAQATVSATQILFELRYEDILNEPFPGHRFTPEHFPGLFAR